MLKVPRTTEEKKRSFWLFFIPSVYSRCMTRFCFNDAESSEEKAVCQQKIHRYISLSLSVSCAAVEL
jgi:hypothetical protein